MLNPHFFFALKFRYQKTQNFILNLNPLKKGKKFHTKKVMKKNEKMHFFTFTQVHQTDFLITLFFAFFETFSTDLRLA
jgi:hypothetical protein